MRSLIARADALGYRRLWHGEHHLNQRFGIRPWNQGRRVHLERQAPEFLFAQNAGDRLTVKVLSIDLARKRLALSVPYGPLR